MVHSNKNISRIAMCVCECVCVCVWVRAHVCVCGWLRVLNSCFLFSLLRLISLTSYFSELPAMFLYSSVCFL